MATLQRSAIVPYTCEQMYGLVNDIARYQEFVPYCTSSVVHSENEHEIRATLVLSTKGIKKSFSTRNRLQKNCSMEIALIDGPFKSLAGLWKFEAHSEKNSEVILNLEFEFANKLFSMMFGSVFQQVSSSLVDAFVSRAHVVYDSQILSKT